MFAKDICRNLGIGPTERHEGSCQTSDGRSEKGIHIREPNNWDTFCATVEQARTSKNIVIYIYLHLQLNPILIRLSTLGTKVVTVEKFRAIQ